MHQWKSRKPTTWCNQEKLNINHHVYLKCFNSQFFYSPIFHDYYVLYVHKVVESNQNIFCSKGLDVICFSTWNFITQCAWSRTLQDLSIALLWHLRTFVIVNYAATRIDLMHGWRLLSPVSLKTFLHAIYSI